jgi:hypothetical protein
MVKRALGILLAVVPLLAGGCVLHDGSADVRLLPEGPIHVQDGYLLLYVETDATGKARLFLDERDTGKDLGLNELTAVLLLPLEDGDHTLQARVYDGTRAVWSNVVALEIGPPPP